MAYPILFMIQHLNCGGTEDHFHDLVSSLDPKLFEPHVIHFNDLNGIVALQIAGLSGVRREFIPINKAYDLSGFGAALAVRRYLRRHAIRAVLTYHFAADFIGTLAALGRGIPVISSRRDMGFTRTSRQLKMGAWMDRGVTRYIAVSRAVGRAIAEQERIAPEKIEIIYNGIDQAELTGQRWDLAAARAKLGIAENEIVLGCIANLARVKRHNFLLDAFARLRERNPGLPVRLMLVGEGPMRPAIEARVRELGLAGSVILTGFSQEVTREFQLADIVVLASESEGLSNSLIKAMAFEKPVVTTAVGGNPEVVVDGETGYLVGLDDCEGFAATMERLARDAELRRRLGAIARGRVGELFSMGAMIASHERMLIKLIDGQKK